MVNQQRQEAYLKLIDALLECSGERARELLHANQALVDSGLVQAMEQVTAELTEQGNWDAANSLRTIALQLAAAIDTPLSAGTPVEALILLNELLRAIVASQGARQIVYPLLESHLNRLDNQFAQLLRNWATALLSTVYPEQGMLTVQGIFTLGSLIQEFPSGNRASNLEIALACYEIALQLHRPETLPRGWAGIQYNLGTVYSQRLEGDRAENLEKAVKCYQNALKIYSQEEYPQEWANIQNNLGTAYSQRIGGNRAQNIEQAIQCYKNTLQVYTYRQEPREWARTQNNLGSVYCERIYGDRVENLKFAIGCYENALRVRTRAALPDEWAATQTNLEKARRTLNQLLAVEALIAEEKLEWSSSTPTSSPLTTSDSQLTFLKQVLQATRSSNGNPQVIYPLLQANLDQLDDNLAQVLRKLGISALSQVEPEQAPVFALDIASFSNLISEFPLGNRANNLEIAFTGYIVAAMVFTREAFPQDWARNQCHLGLACLHRIRGRRAENLEAAIGCFQAALEICTREAYPQDWARTEINLGVAYLHRIRGRRAENLEAAIGCFQAALEICTREAYPQDWARTQNNLGIAYRNRNRGKKAKNLEIAISYFKAALKVRTRETYPQDWAETQINLGNAYYERIREETAENLEAAIRCFQAALGICTREAFPQRYAEIQYSLGLAYQNARQFPNACTAYAAAIDTVESLRGEIFSSSGTEEDKQKLSEQWNRLYRGMVEVHLELHNYAQAIEYVERSKARNLIELLATRDLYPKGDILEAVRSELLLLRQEIEREKRLLAAEATPDYTHLNLLRQQYNELYPYKPIRFDQIQNLINDRSAIVQWYILADYFCAFITTRQNSQPIVWTSSAKDLENLENWFFQYLEAYHTSKLTETEAEEKEQEKRWKTSIAARLQQLAEILHINRILSHLPKTCDQLILVPHLYLHLFPLHALESKRQRENHKGKTLLELFPKSVRYAPSCQLLQLAQTRKRPHFTHLFAIQNPTRDLFYADLEVAAIQSYFTNIKILEKDIATKTALDETSFNTIHCAHFSCHGIFNLASPLESALLLANNERLTLDAIFSLNLDRCRLVILSACETGLIDWSNISDEYIGLVSGFLFAGSPTVVGSLWAVDSVSTAFLLIKFYENLRNTELKEGDVAVALKNAQIWLRNLSSEEGEKFLEKIQPHIDAIFPGKPKSARFFKTGALERIKESGTHPFANPFYWAAFTATGF